MQPEEDEEAIEMNSMKTVQSKKGMTVKAEASSTLQVHKAGTYLDRKRKSRNESIASSSSKNKPNSIPIEEDL